MVNKKMLKEYIEGFASIGDAELSALVSCMEVRYCEKKAIITDLGDQVDCVFLVIKGIARSFFYKGKNEIVVQPAKEGDLVTAYLSFRLFGNK